MLEELSLFLTRYWHFYSRFFSDVWYNMTPHKYCVLLLTISTVGWLLMRKGPKEL